MNPEERPTTIPAGQIDLQANITIPAGSAENVQGIVLFAHGSGSSRHSPRNRLVAQYLHEASLATVLLDLLTEAEEVIDLQTSQLRFNVGLLADRLARVTDWLLAQPEYVHLRVGYFGASTGAAAALIAAAERPTVIQAVVSRGGRPDLAALALPYVQAPTLFIVGSNDIPVIGLNRDAMRQMRSETRLEIVPGAGHLFEEHGALDEVARLTREWFRQHLIQKPKASSSAGTTSQAS